MSYILDALRKAERERHLGQPPSLTVPSLPAEPGQRRLGLWLAVGVGLGLNAALLVFLLTRAPPASTPVVAAPPAPMATATPAPPPAPPALPPAKETSEKAEATAVAQEPARPAAPVRSAALAATVQPNASLPVTLHLAPAGKPVAPEPVRPARRPEPGRLPLAPGSVTLAPAPESTPPLEMLSAGARRGVPPLNLDIHIHSADPDKRFVVINGRRYREGERLSEGPVLESVTRDGAILSQGGQRFQLSVRR